MFVSKRDYKSLLDRLRELEDKVKYHEHSVVVGNTLSSERWMKAQFPYDFDITMTTEEVLQQVIEVLGLEVQKVSASTKLVKKKKGKR